MPPENIKKSEKWSIVEFDNFTRSFAFGYENSQMMYKQNSCKDMIPHIDKPFLLMYSKDDPIALNEDFPRDTVLSNPNCLLVESEFGGHCDF